MNNALLIQQSHGPDGAEMTAATYPRHAVYCARHDWDYWMQHGPVRGYEESPQSAWAKIRLIQQAFLQGYTYVAWLDLDAYISDLDTDLRAACLAPVNMVRWSVPLSHLQAGCIYLNNYDNRAYSLVSSMLDEMKYYLEEHPTLRGWFEQGQLNRMRDWPGVKDYFHELPWEWNHCKYFCPPVEKPVVKSWHGWLSGDWAGRCAEIKREVESEH